MKVNPLSFDHNDVIKTLENKFICSLSPIDYGKAIQTAVEEYVTYMVNLISEKTLLIDIAKNPQLIIDYLYANNGPGFDRLFLPGNIKIQIKLRQVDGKTPYSKQVHFENTRRHSTKNKNKSAESGHVRYAVSEFDYVIVVLCHIVDGERTHYTNWTYSLVSSEELQDVNNEGYCLSKIPSGLLFKNKYDNIYMLTNKLKDLK